MGVCGGRCHPGGSWITHWASSLLPIAFCAGAEVPRDHFKGVRSRTPSVSASVGRRWGAELCIHAAPAGPELWPLSPWLPHPCSARPGQLIVPSLSAALRSARGGAGTRTRGLPTAGAALGPPGAGGRGAGPPAGDRPMRREKRSPAHFGGSARSPWQQRRFPRGRAGLRAPRCWRRAGERDGTGRDGTA